MEIKIMKNINIGKFLSDNFKFLAVTALVLLFYFKGCFDRFVPEKKTSSETTTKQEPQPPVVMPVYIPQQRGATSYPVYIPNQYNPSADISKLTDQYNALVKEFLAVKNYKDSIELKDSSGKKVGVVNLSQIVSENTLKSTQPSYQLNFPHTYTTITNTVYPKPRNQIFLGGGMETGVNNNLIEQAKLGLLLKNKKDLIVGIAGTYDFPSRKPGIEISIFKKISFKSIIR
jgi:hypothetical protein